MRKINFSYFFIWSIIFLVVTIIGFIPSFIFRPVFKDSGLPIYLIVHGIFMMLWFIGFFYQNLLIAKGQLINHKKLGIFWFVLAILVIIGNLNVVISLSHEVLMGENSYYDVKRTFKNTGNLVVGNLYFTVISGILILIAFIKRDTPKTHKRALFGACLFLFLPAFDRFMRYFNLEDLSPLLNFLMLSYIFPISLIVYDIVKFRKVFWITVVFSVCYFCAIPLIMFLFRNNLHKTIIEFLG